MHDAMRVNDVEQWLDRLYIAAEDAGLRDEDRKKAREVAAMLDEIERAAGRFSRRAPLVLVDAAAGKSYVGLLAARLVLEPMGVAATVITIERDDGEGGDRAGRPIARLGTSVPIECRAADVDEAEAWPAEPSIVTALHACGPAADQIIERAVASRARELLLVPCCTSRGVDAAVRAEASAAAFGSRGTRRSAAGSSRRWWTRSARGGSRRRATRRRWWSSSARRSRRTTSSGARAAWASRRGWRPRARRSSGCGARVR